MKSIAVLGPQGHDECAHYIADGLKNIGADVRAIDPLWVRDIIKRELKLDGVNNHYAYRKPLSLQWLVEHPSETVKLAECSIIVITDQPIEYTNDLLPFDTLGNKPIVVFYHNEYNQPPSCVTADIVCYGQPQLQDLYTALYTWGASRARRHFHLPCAAFPERIASTQIATKAPFTVWPNDNFHGHLASVTATRITHYHSLSNDLWSSVDDVLTAAFQHGVVFIGSDTDVS